MAAALAALAAAGSRPAQAAGTAYAAETSEVGEDGGCKIETWTSWASNRDVYSTVSPTCILPGFPVPTEGGLQVARSRGGGDWATAVTGRLKFKLVPTAIGVPGFAVSVAPTYDSITQRTSEVFVNGSSTLRLSNVVRVNVNLGAIWDTVANRQHLFYAAGFDWRTPDSVYTLTAEVFGELGTAERRSETRPRFQTGFRWRPIERWSVDLIYGRNIDGENAHWFTIGTTLRFPTDTAK